MEQHFIVAVRAVVPMFLLILAGMFVRWRKMLSDTELKHVNHMVFEVFFFCMLFYNTYTTNIATVFRPRLIVFAIAALVAVIILAAIFVCLIEKDPRDRGAMIQGIYRSNFVLLGIPMFENIFGPEKLAIPSMMIAIIIPLYNLFAVLVLESFRSGGKFSLSKTVINILKNPMIFGGLVGLAFLLLSVPVPDIILKPIGKISSCTSTVALIILGASFKFDGMVGEIRNLVITIAGRLVFVPLLVLSAAYFLGFRDLEFVTLLAIFATPCAVNSFTMAQEMDSNAQLAGSAVVFSSAISCVTLFIWIVIFQMLGVF